MGYYYLYAMYFKFSGRINPVSKRYDRYYRLVESYRNETGRVTHRTILNVGFLEDELTAEQLNQIARTLMDIHQRKSSLFPQTDLLVEKWVSKFWAEIVAGERLDLTLYDEKSRMVHADTLQHSNVREVGAEWMCYNAWHQLELDKILEESGFSALEVQLAQTQVISRAVNPASELATARWITENSAVMELTGYNPEKMNKDRLYGSALRLSAISDKLEKHLSIKTNELFDIQDRIMLYDLTNTYFEGEKRNSKLAQYGRSKEKRSDCKLVVLALVVNIYGFIKHSSIHEGNFSDCKNIEKVIDSLNYTTGEQKPIVVLDAGIASAQNLSVIRNKGYHYLCVSRTKIKNHKIDPSGQEVQMQTKTNKELTLKKLLAQDATEYILEVNSELKAKKEQGMKTRFEQGYEDELNKIKSAIEKKGGIKQVDKVNQRIGRAKQKYPSAQGRYDIQLCLDAKKEKALSMTWIKNDAKNQKDIASLGQYFIKTSLEAKDEVLVWNIYNTIREIESTFRTLKTDLDLRPIYHKKDESTIAHLKLGLLAYWLVNTIRQQLKSKGINSCWKEIVRIGNTQKVITTTGYNKAQQEITVRKCSEPTLKLKELFLALQIKQRPFSKLKSVVHKLKLKNSQCPQIRELLSG
jgi:transposase